MLRNLKYVSEIAVDVTNNSVQSLFWLGAAHASGVYAISIRHDSTEQEKQRLTVAGEERGQRFPIKAGRSIFDISGLWTAVLHAYDTKRFYAQLEQVQKSIEQRSKVLHWSADTLEDELIESYWEPVSLFEEEEDSKGEKGFDKLSRDTYRERSNRESELLESYYRNRFWRPMLKRNQLEIFVCQDDLTGNIVMDPQFIRSYVPAWDVEAISTFSQYLSKRKMIGQYHFSLEPRNSDSDLTTKSRRNIADLEKTNYICVGAQVNPFNGKMLQDYLNQTFEESKEYNPHFSILANSDQSGSEGGPIKRGFASNSDDFLLQSWILLPNHETDEQNMCEKISYLNCAKRDDWTNQIGKDGLHYELGQLLLWRELAGVSVGGSTETANQNTDSNSKKNTREPYSFRASLVGASWPATSALSTLFIDVNEILDDKNEELLTDYKNLYKVWSCGRKDSCRLQDAPKNCPLKYSSRSDCPEITQELSLPDTLFPLTALQREIRSILFAKYCTMLNKNLQSIEAHPWDDSSDKSQMKQERDDYIRRVVNAANLYLSTTLYRRFFPFLSQEDEARICNGLDLFIRKAMTDSVSPFSLAYTEVETAKQNPLEYSDYSAIILNKDVEDAAKITVKTLKDLLNSLQAVEVFYKVLVDFHKDEERGITARRIKRIDLVTRKESGYDKRTDESETYHVRCIFKEPTDKHE